MTLKKAPLSIFKRLSLRLQLTAIIFGTILITFVIETIFFTFQEQQALEKVAKDNVEAIARSMSPSFVKIILRDPADVSADVVSALKEFPSIQDVYLFNKERYPVFQFHHSDSLLTNIPKPKEDKAVIVTEDGIHLFLPVHYQNTRLGYVYFRMSKQLLEQWESRQLMANVTLIVLVLMIAFFVSNYFQSYFLSPILKLTETMRQISDKKDYSIRTSTDEYDEIGTLYSGFNQMLCEIQKVNKDLNDQKYAMDQTAIISITNIRGDIIYCNEKFSEISGYSRGELMGINHRILKSEEHDKKFFQTIWKTIASGKTWHGIIKNKAKNGHYYWVDSTIVPILDDKGRVSEYLSIRFEITQQKIYEQELFQLNHNLEQVVAERTKKLQQSNEQLIKSEKMASLGELVAGVAHEINTPLGNSVTGASYLQEELRQLQKNAFSGKFTQKDLTDFIETSNEACHIITENLGRAANLIKSFKRVSVDQTSQLIREFNLAEYINDTLLSLRPALKKTRLQVQVNCDESLQLISFPGAISQILTNFINNSLRYAYETGDQGRLEITVTQPDDETVLLLYADDGKGMNEEVGQRIFDPFFTTGRSKGGTGLGLHVVYNIVTQQLNGEIHCESQEGVGSQFFVQIPRRIGINDKEEL